MFERSGLVSVLVSQLLLTDPEGQGGSSMCLVKRTESTLLGKDPVTSQVCLMPSLIHFFLILFLKIYLILVSMDDSPFHMKVRLQYSR